MPINSQRKVALPLPIVWCEPGTEVEVSSHEYGGNAMVRIIQFHEEERQAASGALIGSSTVTIGALRVFRALP